MDGIRGLHPPGITIIRITLCHRMQLRIIIQPPTGALRIHIGARAWVVVHRSSRFNSIHIRRHYHHKVTDGHQRITLIHIIRIMPNIQEGDT